MWSIYIYIHTYNLFDDGKTPNQSTVSSTSANDNDDKNQSQSLLSFCISFSFILFDPNTKWLFFPSFANYVSHGHVLCMLGKCLAIWATLSSSLSGANSLACHPTNPRTQPTKWFIVFNGLCTYILVFCILYWCWLVFRFVFLMKCHTQSTSFLLHFVYVCVCVCVKSHPIHSSHSVSSAASLLSRCRWVIAEMGARASAFHNINSLWQCAPTPKTHCHFVH